MIEKSLIQSKVVGVVIPIYNVEKYLKECLDSVINQTYTNLEIILVNDGSTDENSLNIAKEYTLKDKRITLFDKKNGGQSTARNVGIEYFSGEYKLKNKTQTLKENSLIEFNIEGNNPYEIYTVYKSYKAFNNEQDLTSFTYPSIDYIIFLDSDDYWELNCIEECVPRMDGVDVVWFDWKFINATKIILEYGTRLKDKYAYKEECIITSSEWIKKSFGICFKQKLFAFAVSGMIRFASLKSIKLKFLDFIKHEDILFGNLLFSQVNNIYVLPKELYVYRIHDVSISDYLNNLSKLPNYLYIIDIVFSIDIAKKYYSIISMIFVAKELIKFIEKLNPNFEYLFLKVILPELCKRGKEILSFEYTKDPCNGIFDFFLVYEYYEKKCLSLKRKKNYEHNNLKNKIEVTLVIPAFNAGEFIHQTLESVKNQNLKNFECIIVNDFSSDNTVEVVKSTVKNDNRFKIINHKANVGSNASRNSGLRIAKGKYVAFLDADDLIMPNSLLYRKQTLDANYDEWTIGAYCGSVTIDEDCKFAPEETPCRLGVKDFITSMGQCPFNVNQPMFKTDVLKQLGGFDQGLTQAEDYDMWIKIMRKGYEFTPTQVKLVTYRMRKGSMIRKDPMTHLANSMYTLNQCYLEDKSDEISVFKKGLPDYIIQREKIDRVLNFSGMAVAAGNSLDDILKRICKEIPDYFLIRRKDYEKLFYNRLLAGINRFFGSHKTLEELDDYLMQKCKNIYNNFLSFSEEKSSNNTILYDYDIVFIPHKDYHTHAIMLMNPYLDAHNIRYIILDISMHYKDEKAISAAKEYNLPYIGYGNFVLRKIKPKSIVVFNDWELVTKAIISMAKKSGITTIGIVEGINDYLDVDTKRTRKAYQSVEYLFLPGTHDKKYFKNPEQKIFIGGIPRIYNMYHENKKQLNLPSKSKIALINSNFSYGVLTEHRDKWLKQAVEVCLKAGYKPIITRHPADLGMLYPELVTSKSFYDILEECDVLISRFASGILEALARDKLPIYFNPHGEMVDKFKSPMDAYPIANSDKELFEILFNLEFYYRKGTGSFKKFIQYHCGSVDKNPSEIIVSNISKILQSQDKSNFSLFHDLLCKLDSLTNCFENRKMIEGVLLGIINIYDYDKNIENILNECLDSFKREKYNDVDRYLNYLQGSNIDQNVVNKIIKLKNILFESKT
ncbi:glycosyltransferase [Campylobacter lari]|nr:glycosyltransferase [Campylobacter lari]